MHSTVITLLCHMHSSHRCTAKSACGLKSIVIWELFSELLRMWCYVLFEFFVNLESNNHVLQLLNNTLCPKKVVHQTHGGNFVSF